MYSQIMFVITVSIISIQMKPTDLYGVPPEKGFASSGNSYLPPAPQNGFDKTNYILGTVGHYFTPPPSQLDYAILEQESIPSKKDSLYTNLHEFVANFYQPKPIVDTVQEHEKYGNTGDKFYSVGRVVVNKVEDLANLINTAAEIPGNVFKAIVATVTEKLNNLGGKIVGLAK